MTDDLYHQQILDLYHDPINFGELKDADYILTETNASCGDSYTFYLKLSTPPDKKRGEVVNLPSGLIIKKITFTGVGCAISKAASSLVTEHLHHQPLGEIAHLTPDFMENLIGTQISATRLKCLMLPVKALDKVSNATR